MSPSLHVRFIKSLFLKEIISLKDVDIGEKTAGYLLQKQLKRQARSSIEREQNLVIALIYNPYVNR